MNASQFALAAGFAVILLIVVIALRGSTRVRQVTTRKPGDSTATTNVDSSASDCGSSNGGGGCD